VIIIPTDFHEAKLVEDRIVEEAEKRGYDEEAVFALRLSLAEALANAIRHGNGQQETKHINIRYGIDKQRIEIYVEDEGCGFRPDDVPDPTLDENLENPSGRGIMLMRAYMNLVEYNERGNIVHLVKFNKPA